MGGDCAGGIDNDARNTSSTSPHNSMCQISLRVGLPFPCSLRNLFTNLAQGYRLGYIQKADPGCLTASPFHTGVIGSPRRLCRGLYCELLLWEVRDCGRHVVDWWTACFLYAGYVVSVSVGAALRARSRFTSKS